MFALVVGLPLNMDGSEGPRAQATRAFLRNFSALNATPCALWDERLSTAAVDRALIEQDVSRARRAAVVDRMAAAYILQGALDRLATIARGKRVVSVESRILISRIVRTMARFKHVKRVLSLFDNRSIDCEGSRMRRLER